MGHPAFGRRNAHHDKDLVGPWPRHKNLAGKRFPHSIVSVGNIGCQSTQIGCCMGALIIDAEVVAGGKEVYKLGKDGVQAAGRARDELAWRAAADRLDTGARRALERATGNLERFHRALIPPDVRAEPEPGVALERRSVPVRRVGVYAPGGRAAYPSSVLMGVVPARAVGVSEVIVCSPPGKDGRVSDAVLAAAWIGGADRLFAVGGAGAIAALAYGTETIPTVDVVVGPGNRWVNEAKKQVAGEVRIDSPAGPSELLVLADGNAEPTVVARMDGIERHEADIVPVLGIALARIAEANQNQHRPLPRGCKGAGRSLPPTSPRPLHRLRPRPRSQPHRLPRPLHS